MKMTEVQTKYIVESTTINSELKRLKAEYLVLRTHVPLAIGIRSDLIPVINLNSRNSRKVIRLICSCDAYLKNLAGGGDRFGLDGRVKGAVTEAEVKQAKERLLEVKINNLSKEKSSKNILKLRRNK